MVATKWYNYEDLVYHALKESKEFFKRTKMHTVSVEEGMEQ